MTISKAAVRQLAQEIRECRVAAVANAQNSGKPGNVYAYMAGAVESTVAHFVQSQNQDSTEVRAAFSYEPTPEEVTSYREEWARRMADHAKRAEVRRDTETRGAA